MPRDPWRNERRAGILRAWQPMTCDQEVQVFKLVTIYP